MEGKKQTAVEWLIEKMKTYNMTVSVHNTSHENVMDFYKAIEQAKEMEREQIIEACDFGRAYGYNQATGYPNPISNPNQYYDKTYGKDKSET
jgi:sulfatase maturation enzyme AslB (radical SAM superfamily)